jgi:2-methylcitrate dehydratase PrpD
VLFPALLALSTPGTSVTRLLEAYAVGVEVMARLGRALGASHYEAGWHPTGTAGTIAAAAAGAYLRALPTEEAARAVSLAASQAGGLRFQFGTEAKPLHAGLAAQSAVQAVQLAIAGVTANPDFLDPRAGFLAAHGVGPGLDELTAPCGPRWRLLDPGLWFKQYPYCSAAMSAGDAAAGLATWVAGADIDHVVVRVPPGADTALRHPRPATGEEGRFSLEYVVALRLTDTAPDSASLGPRPVAAALDALVIRTSREHVTPPPSAGRSFWAEVEVTLGDGRRRAVAVEHPTGSPRAPLTVEQHRAKLVTATGSPHAADAVGAALADAATVGSLMTAVANAVGATDPRPDPRSPNQEGPR